MSKLVIKGGPGLNGEVRISGSKNAALPIMAATLLIKGETVLRNVPDIADIHAMMELLEKIGAKTDFKNNTLRVDATRLKNASLLDDNVKQMRASILLLGPMVARLGEVKLAFPGGCVLGKRPVDVHIFALERLKAKITEGDATIAAKADRLEGNFIVLPETSVTATENAIMAAVLAKGETQIRLAASEPHVQDLCRFLNKAGAKIRGIGTHNLTIDGVKSLKPVTYSITSDYIETGTLAIAAVLTKGNVTLTHCDPDDLDVFWSRLREVGGNFTIEKDKVIIKPYKGKLKAIRQLRTAVYPGFPTDLQAPFAILLTQANGESQIFETLFDGRLSYLFELEKMGLKVDILNPHLARIMGPAHLKGCEIASCDIRAGASMVLAALVADGVTEISNIKYIDRGYERLEEKLKSLGADVVRE
ncbi:UDP-N-acetylglucosamine 1-carboxyvinyltransferase [Patescibacteria group bacterium]|nr:UDP-N-acetylglucosamine 1-carboxyvinyltransferase [Patescibacteria group bacterium]